MAAGFSLPGDDRWSKSGVLDRVFAALQEEQILRVNVEAVALVSTRVKVHSDGTGAPRCKPWQIPTHLLETVTFGFPWSP